jgi:pSer/pThr/pTyr-binding forkhead associated (FHA) protein
MAHGKTTITFRIQPEGAPARTEELAQDIIKIGKLPSSHLRIEDEGVSRMHAVIESAGGEVHVIDLGSATGTFVNGKKVNKARLASGDELGLGGAKVIVTIVEAARAIAAPSPSPSTSHVSPFTATATANPFTAPLPNPFAAPVNTPVPAAPAPESEITYTIAATAPAPSADEVETPALAAEVMILWGDRSVLHVAHLSPPRAFTVGERVCDFVVDGLVTGADQLPLTLEQNGQVVVVIPAGATGEVRTDAEARSIEALRAEGRLAPCAALAGAEQYVLPQGATASIAFHGFTFVTKATSAGKRIGAATPASLRNQLWVGLSFAVHAAFLGMFYFMPPSASALSLDLMSADDRLVQYLMTPPESVTEPQPEWLNETPSTETEGGTGQAAADESGQMGETSSEHTTHRYGIEGHSDHPQLARDRSEQARDAASAIGAMLAATGAFDAPTSPYGADQALGADPMSAIGALMGDQVGTNWGLGGMGMHGTGRGGGGLGLGTIGLGRLGTIGHGAGTGPGNGYGDGVGDFTGGPAQHVPRIRTGDADVRGALSAEVIRRTIRRHINEVRFCYEQQLSSRPDLAGRVTVSFIISQTGAVASSAVQSSTLGNATVESCISTAVHRWTFPAPDGGGVVGVNYPFVLDSTGQ